MFSQWSVADSRRDGIKVLKNIKRIGETKTEGGKLVCVLTENYDDFSNNNMIVR